VTVEKTAPLVGCLNAAEASPLRLQKNDSRKMEKHFRSHFFGDFSCYLNKLHSYHSGAIEAPTRRHKARTEEFGHETAAHSCRCEDVSIAIEVGPPAP
jgi:hypothetical protein